MLRRRTIFLCVLSLSLVGIRPAASNPYFIQNVGPITNSGYISDLGLNDSGEMVGTNNEMAWSWTASGGLVQLNPLLAAAAPTASWAWKINDAGQICGTYLDATGQNDCAYIYSANSGATNLGTFTDPPVYTAAQATAYRINASGQVAVGFTATSGLMPADVADVVSSNGTVLQSLGAVGGYPYGIDNAGDTAGLGGDDNGWYCPFGGTATNLASLASGRVNVQGMSGNGQIVGNCYDGGTAPHAMLWKSGTATPTDLGTLGNSASTSLAYGVDDANGQVVGWSYLSGGTTFTAFVWSSGTGMVNLNTSGLVTNLATSGFSYLNAGVCVNDSGQIAGFGTYPSQSGSGAGGVYEAFLLTPAISGDANLDGRVDINDLTIVLAHYGQSGEWAQGEFTGSGTVDINDLTIVLAHYGQSENYGSPAAGLAAVPEPASLGLLSAAMAALLLLLSRRQRD